MSDPSPTEAVISAWARLIRAQRITLHNVEADLKKAGLPPLGWYDALLELKRVGEAGLRPVELEGRLLLAQHNVSRLIDRLEAAAYVERRPCDDDGRGQMVTLTEAGRAVLERMWPVYAAAIQHHVGEKLESDVQAQALAALLGRLVRSER
jgi:DNA-binding MarR family transcriptional regulator